MKKILMLALSTAFSAYGGVDREKFTLGSDSFKDGGAIPLEFTKKIGGENISPQLSWRNPPPGTGYYVISCIDIHPVARRWVHWMVVNIPAAVSSLAEGASCGNMPQEAEESENSFGRKGWGGPRPPAGSGVHQYVFTVYAVAEA
ncbi:MAG: YbhB/YbcL family Raf kinase inhibitor-like protein, partial [Victivallales bacterium]|nr:YbhB/YbcL family Raf kinase inhibitor-like protein [Victivallales bacterium]